MSIIYEALNKTQKTRETIVKPSLKARTMKHKTQIRYLLLTSLASFTLLIAYLTYLKFDTKSDVNMIIDKPLVLNGVFLIGEKKFAMINNEEYKVGDKINNMSVVNIDMNNVKLQTANRKIQVLTVA